MVRAAAAAATAAVVIIIVAIFTAVIIIMFIRIVVSFVVDGYAVVPMVISSLLQVLHARVRRPELHEQL